MADVKAEETNLSKAVVEDNFEKFAEESNQRDISEKLGKVAPAPEKKEAQATEEVKAEPDPVKHESKSPHKLTWGQLRAKVRELEAENRGLKVGRTAELPAEVVESEVKAAEPEKLRKRPQSEDVGTDGKPKYKTWQEYEDDLLSWNEEKILRAVDERSSKKSQEAQITEINKSIEKSWSERVEKAREAHEDFDDALQSEIVQMIKPGSLVDEWILDSEQGAELLYYFHNNPDELKKFEDVKGPTPGARRATVRRMLTKIEDKILGDVKEQPEPAPKKEEPEARITKTLPPSREVGGRGAAPTDRVRAAVANDDVGAYLDEMNRRDIREKFGDRR